MDYYGKKEYLSKEAAEEYDAIRFATPQGQYVNTMDMHTVQKCVSIMKNRVIWLDLACGTGRFAELALNYQYNVICADISLEQLKLAVNRVSNRDGQLYPIRCDAESLPFKNGVFDCVSAMRFTGLLPRANLRRMLAEISWTTREWAIIDVHNTLSLNIFWIWLQKFKKEPQKTYCISPRQLRREIKTVGLRIIKRYNNRFVAPENLPPQMLPFVKAINYIALRSFLGYFSMQYVVLLQKIDLGPVIGCFPMPWFFK
jgi:SAM-dependent methyltransferase